MKSEEHEIWYYVSIGNERLGPVSIKELSSLANKGDISPLTLVWSPDHPGWMPASTITHLLSQVTPIREESEETITEISSSSEEPLSPITIKPRKTPFLFPRLVGALIISLLSAVVLAGVLFNIGKVLWPALAIVPFGIAIGIVTSLAAYRKEVYLIQESRLVGKRGGLFSDESTELEIRNITHVKVRLPWLRYRFLKVGDVIVETAGSSKPLVMRAISSPEEIFSDVRKRMKHNGYDLTERQILHEERPAILGAIVECLGILAGAVAFCLFFLANMVIDLLDESNLTVSDQFVQIGIGSILILILVFLIIRYLDLRRRTYRVFNDVVVYEEGFLTRQNAFIPYENIADSNTKRTFIDQVLGLYDVLVSCQGSGTEIKFRRLRNGDDLSGAIDHLVTEASKKPKLGKSQQGINPEAHKSRRPGRLEPETVSESSIRTAEYRIHALRLLIPQLLLIPLFPVWVVAMFKSLILITSTRYFVRPNSLRHSYKFLTVDDREFSYDKITGVVVKRNLWDRWFNTMTVKFWSIGSGKALEFAHVHCDLVDLPALIRQAGIPSSTEEKSSVDTSFQFMPWLRSKVWIVAVVVFLSVAVVFVAIQAEEHLIFAILISHILYTFGGIIRAKLYFSRQRLVFHEHHVEAEQGVVSKSLYYVRYKNIKRTTAVRYPGGEEGSLRIYVAGEELALAQQSKAKNIRPRMKQCSFTTEMLPDAFETAQRFDDILAGRPDPLTAAEPVETLVESSRSIGSALARLFLISIVLFPLIALLPLTIPIAFIRIKQWRYRIDTLRIITNYGILFRKQTSVLLDRVDSLKQSQGFLNKIFRNGNVSVMTAGSSNPDLILIDSPDFRKLHDSIREQT